MLKCFMFILSPLTPCTHFLFIYLLVSFSFSSYHKAIIQLNTQFYGRLLNIYADSECIQLLLLINIGLFYFFILYVFFSFILLYFACVRVCVCLSVSVSYSRLFRSLPLFIFRSISWYYLNDFSPNTFYCLYLQQRLRQSSNYEN